MIYFTADTHFYHKNIIFITICATIYNADKWEGLTSICMVKSERIIGEHSCVEEGLYISSLKPDAKLIGEAIRKHWGVENSLHWVLDVAFNEDKRAQKN